MPELIPADQVLYEHAGRSVELELDDLRRRVQTGSDLIAHMIIRIQALEARDA
jgi:hypothetical protein